MELLAAHYDIPSINVALKTVELARAGKLVYQSAEPTPSGVIRFSSDGVHPLDEGHQIYTDVIAAAVRQMADSKPIDHQPSLASTFVADHWQAAKMVPIAQPMLSGSWRELSPGDELQRRFGERMGTLWESGKPGSRLSFKFRGSIARLYDLVGPDGGQVVVTVDGVERPKPVPRFDSYCTSHRIATLPRGSTQIRFIRSPSKSTRISPIARRWRFVCKTRRWNSSRRSIRARSCAQARSWCSATCFLKCPAAFSQPKSWQIVGDR
jgi:hypothetical protein